MSRKLNFAEIDLPSELPPDSIEAIKRILKQPRVMGVMFFKDNQARMSSVPMSMEHILTYRLPIISDIVYRAITEITASINDVNPVVDRIMDDDSVESVIMTNDQGNPILTNVSLIASTNFSNAFHRIGEMARRNVQEMDPFDEILVLRVKTKKFEVMLAPKREFNIIVVQHARSTNRRKNNRNRRAIKFN